VVYRREGANPHLGTFAIASAEDTDGLDVVNMPLGPLFPQGMFVVQNSDRDFQMVPWQRIATALGLAIDTQGYDVRGGECQGLAAVSVTPAEASLPEGDTIQLTATAQDEGGGALTGCTLAWSTSDPGIATVSSSGLVGGVGAGSATITATSGTVNGTASVTVEAAPNADPVVTLGPIPTAAEGAIVGLTASFDDADAADVHTATIDWGDGTAVQAGSVNQAAKAVTGSHVYANDGAYVVTVAVRDGRSGIGADDGEATVANVAPTANPGGPYSGFTGATISFVGSASDPGADTLRFEWDFAYDGSFEVAASGPSVQRAFAAGSSTVALRVWDDDVATLATTSLTVSDRPTVVLYLSLSGSATLGGASVANEDVVAFDGTGFSLHFDGSDVGLASTAIDGLAVLGPSELLLSFTDPVSVPGIPGTVDDSDVVKFTATSLGAQTTGSFTLYFDGSDVGLSTSDEDVDAIELAPGGGLLVSTTGAVSVPGVSAQDEDLLLFTPTSLGSTTAGSWALHFDGSDVALTSSDEDVDAVAVDAGARILLSTTGSFSVAGRSGADEDVFAFVPSTTGPVTAGSFASVLVFDGSLYGLGGNDVVAIDVP
jgi:hypothetical protein